MKITLAVAALAAACAWAPLAARAADYPTRPVRMVVPYAPGGGIDVVSRLVAQKLSEAWGQPVVVDNRPGAGASLGTEMVARAAPDGYTILMAANTIAISAGNPVKPAFNLTADFTPITMTARAPMVFVVGTAVPATSMKALIELSKSRPGGVNIGSAGQGGILHLGAELVKARSGLVMTHVPYKGTAAAMTDVIGGRIDGLYLSPSVVVAQANKGTMRPLAVSTATRSKALPNVPTMMEAGVPDYDVSLWFGLLAPAGTPPAIIDRIHSDVATILAMPEVAKNLDAQGFEAISMRPDEFGRLIRNEVNTWSALIRSAGIKLE